MLSKEQFVQCQCSIHVFNVNAKVILFSETDSEKGMRGSRGGEGQGARTPPEKSQNYRVSYQYLSGSPEKSLSYQARRQCWGPSSARQRNAI